MMYSKAGKISIELFPWIQQRDAIINGEKKKTYEISIFDDIPHSKRPYKSFKENAKLSPRETSQPKVQPFSKQVGRVESKKELDRYGFYNPKYHLVQKRSPLTDGPDHFRQINSDRSLSSKTIKRSLKLIKPTLKHNCDTSKEYLEKKQLQEERKLRAQEYQPDLNRFPLPEGPNEHRFEYQQYPQSQYNRSPNPIIRPRSSSSKLKFKEQKNGQIYDLNYTVIYPKSDKMIPVLDKLTPRQPFNSDKPVYTFHETLSDDTPKKRNSPQSFKLDQQVSREKAMSYYSSIRRLYYL
ncbi:unnamed protein product (macronuclear) [Paramecium tetraurelia]|uniref:Uncharacterized protein n=1 Tax=Paramecium tetraurelia TaxID=5888 RepID=A0CQE1_PARTE|nr:uncharacterized protein GSPATT00009356001 [Paramecium tetraurelia]CAK73008.1 unnamed protein product [Paramecium tetraurelia]|eukprot:XP_001440405.1 hypothetical protein (macronuclear) [Paramecium tetraurelia strain d4-2]